ncbi:MAG: T9SS type A sorting domain-containing protein, partial [Bacteroidota bacterium]
SSRMDNMETILSIGEGDPQSEIFKFYPNPAEDWFVLDGLTERTNYEILDTSGRIWKRGSVDPERAIYLVSLPAGTYLLRAWDTKGYSLVEKIVRMGP